MIRIERRPAAVAVAALARVGRNGLSERDHALWFYAGVAPQREVLPPQPAKAPAFKAYKRVEVRNALIANFGVKCAYCESPYAHLNAMDVEHFRPKSGFLDSGKLRKPGYFWLAASYDNLFPSCGDCNRERKLCHREKDGRLVQSKSGKANLFPIANGSVRATCAAEQANERPLLLNPCDDEPAHHLDFLADGFVAPADTTHEAEAPRGRASILTYGLARADLVAQRHEWSLLAQAAMQRVLETELNIRETPSNPRLPGQLASAEAALQATFFSAGARYRAMMNAMRRAFDAVRVAADAYYSAVANWKASQSATDRQNVVACVARIRALRSDPSMESDFIADLLRWADVQNPQINV